MSLWSVWRRLLFYLRRDEFERDLEEEMRLHREMKLGENLASGMGSEDARRAAEREFGRTARLLEESRETWSFALLDSLWLDVRLGFRALRMRPGFTAVALVSLALGIGANTAVFTLVNEAFFRPLPIRAPGELVSLTNDASRRMFPAFSYPNYEDLRDRTDAFSGLIAYRFAPLSVSHDGIAERMWGYLVSGNYFEVLGIEPALGRLLSAEDDVLPGGHPVAVVSHRSWIARFGGEPGIVGKDVLVNGRSYTVIGVAAPGFDGTEIVIAPEIFIPVAMQSAVERGGNWLDDRAAETAILSLSLAAIGIYGVMSQIMSRRRREMGIRVALGARGEDVIQLAMAAGMAPTFLGVILGGSAAMVLSRWMTSLLFGVSPRDPLTFAATAGLLLFVAALSCFLPARRAAKAAPMHSLRAD